jgi:pimeloyl-ACP methyl ester carboxylesterase
MRRALAGLAAAVLLAAAPAATAQPALTPDELTQSLIETITGSFAGAEPERDPVDIRRDVTVFRVSPFPERPVPAIFWYERHGVEVALARQLRPAPLVYLIAGTGASIRSPSTQRLARVLFGLGNHVLMLPSPTHPAFIVSASTTAVPGRPADDARDLYRLMQLARPTVERRARVTRAHLVGFSLGGLNAAFVAELDSRERAIGFERTVLVNPPVDLIASARVVDELFDRYLQREPEGVDRFVDRVLNALGEVYLAADEPDISPEVIYGTLDILGRDPTVLEQLVGFSFRLSTANMTFTTDVMTHRGFFVASDAQPGIITSLTDVFSESLDHSLLAYIEQVAVPFFTSRDPALTPDALKAEPRLATIGPFLRGSPNVRAITNRNDLILAPGQLDELRDLLGSRLTVFPQGGHGGSLTRPEFREAVREALAQ